MKNFQYKRSDSFSQRNAFSPKITLFLGKERKNWEKRSEKSRKNSQNKKKSPFIIAHFWVVVKPRFFYRGYQMELFRVYLKMKIRGENRLGILQKNEMKNPQFFNWGLWGLVSERTEVCLTLIDGTDNRIIFNHLFYDSRHTLVR